MFKKVLNMPSKFNRRHQIKLLFKALLEYCQEKWCCSTVGSDRFRYNRSEVFCKKAVLKSFAKFIVKHLCRSLILLKLQASSLKETLTQKFHCRLFQISNKNVSLQNNSGGLLLEIHCCDWEFRSYLYR